MVDPRRLLPAPRSCVDAAVPWSSRARGHVRERIRERPARPADRARRRRDRRAARRARRLGRAPLGGLGRGDVAALRGCTSPARRPAARTCGCCGATSTADCASRACDAGAGAATCSTWRPDSIACGSPTGSSGRGGRRRRARVPLPRDRPSPATADAASRCGGVWLVAEVRDQDERGGQHLAHVVVLEVVAARSRAAGRTLIEPSSSGARSPAATFSTGAGTARKAGRCTASASALVNSALVGVSRAAEVERRRRRRATR